MKFLISTMPEAGHVHPVLPISAALVERGHRVLWHTWPDWAAAVEGTGAEFVPARHTPSLLELPPEPDAGTRGIRASLSVQRKHLVERMCGQVADYEALHDDIGVDAVVSDLCCMGALAFSERRGVPCATVGISPLSGAGPNWPPFGSGNPPPRSWVDRAYNASYHRLARVVMGANSRTYNGYRAGLGIPPVGSLVDHLVSPQLHLQAGSPAIEFPCDPWPANVRLVGPLLAPEPAAPEALPDWWPRIAAARRVLHVTQGTIVGDPDTIARPAIAAFADTETLVVVTTPEPDRVGPTPANTIVTRYVPHRLLLPHCDAIVTNGGFNGTKMALSHGIPLVIAPWGNDQPDVATRVARAGAGIDLRVRHPSAAQIQDAVRLVLDDPRYRQAAGRVAEEFHGYDGGHVAAEHLEAFVTSSR